MAVDRKTEYLAPPPGDALESGKSALPYLTQLDAVRALAVAAVLLQHYAPLGGRALPTGYLGVRVFFVLSGFLITSVLLSGRHVLEANGQSPLFTLRQFYGRRFLRIFPVFYLTLAVLTLVDVPGIRESLGWHVAYLSNVYLVRHATWDPLFVHFWTLAVEEQFYLAWPWLMLLAPRARLGWIVVAAIASAPLYRAVALLAGWHDTALAALPFGCLDTLGMGALLALCWHEPGYARLRLALARAGLWVGLPIVMVTMVLWPLGIAMNARLVLLDTWVALACFWLIDQAARGFGGGIGRVLSARPLAYVGRISYGIYIFHMFLPLVVFWLLQQAGMTDPSSALIYGLSVPATIGVAAVSWHVVEKPLNDLKRHLPYHRPVRTERHVAQASSGAPIP